MLNGISKRFSGFLLASTVGALLLAGCGLATPEAMVLPTSQNAAGIVESVEDLVTDFIVEQPAAPVAAPVVAEQAVDTQAQTAPVVSAPNIVAAAVELAAQEQVLVDLYRRVNPAVVSVNLTQGGGSGFVIDADGFIVTNNHVVEQGGPIFIRFASGDIKDAEVVGTDPAADIALLKVDAAPGELTVVPLGDSDSLLVGQTVIAIGSPFGLDNTMTTGIVSGLSRALPGSGMALGASYQVPDVIQTDAAINPGNSGGPLLTLSGEVVGVNTAIESPVRANSGVGFSVPSNVVAVVVAQLRENGVVTYPWLGISGGTLNPEAAEALGLDRAQRGVIISTVVAGGPAASAGLLGGDPATGLGGDVVTAIDGRPIVEFDDLLGYVVQQTRVGQTVELSVLRDGSPVTLNLTLGARPEEQPVN